MAYKETINIKKKELRICGLDLAHSITRKLNDETLELFSRIINQTEASKLVLKYKTMKLREDKMLERLIKFNIDEERVEILAWVKGRKSHLDATNMLM